MGVVDWLILVGIVGDDFYCLCMYEIVGIGEGGGVMID